MTENFMSICPRNKSYTGYNISGIPLKVIQSDGIEYNPHIDFGVSELQNGVKYFKNNSGKSDSFKITCMVNTQDTVEVSNEFYDWSYVYRKENPDFPLIIDEQTWDGRNIYAKIRTKVKLNEALDYFIRKGEPFYITTRAVGINKEDLWIITGNQSRKQEYDDGYTKWELTFTKYIPVEFTTFKNTNTAVTNAIKKYQNQKKAKAKATAKTKTTAKANLKKKCKANNLKYSAKKKTSTCVKYMQQVLNKKGCLDKKQIDGWYGNKTKTAVKQFQKKYKKKYKCKTDGNVDANTFKALCNA